MNINDIELKNIKGFIAQDEALRLYELAKEASLIGPCLEIGSYCGKTASYIGMGCRENGCVLFSMGKPGTLPVLIYIFLSRPFCPSRVFAIIQQKSFSKIREVSLYFHRQFQPIYCGPDFIRRVIEPQKDRIRRSGLSMPFLLSINSLFASYFMNFSLLFHPGAHQNQQP